MTDNELRIAVAESLGFVWHKRRNGIIAASDYWGETRLSYPPEEGIAFQGTKGTVSETRLCTQEEIELAKSTGKFNGLSIPNYLTSLDACHEGWEKDAPVEYWERLFFQINGRWPQDFPNLKLLNELWVNVASSIAEQRCRAFLKWSAASKGKEV